MSYTKINGINIIPESPEPYTNTELRVNVSALPGTDLSTVVVKVRGYYLAPGYVNGVYSDNAQFWIMFSETPVWINAGSSAVISATFSYPDRESVKIHLYTQVYKPGTGSYYNDATFDGTLKSNFGVNGKFISSDSNALRLDSLINKYVTYIPIYSPGINAAIKIRVQNTSEVKSDMKITASMSYKNSGKLLNDARKDGIVSGETVEMLLAGEAPEGVSDCSVEIICKLLMRPNQTLIEWKEVDSKSYNWFQLMNVINLFSNLKVTYSKSK